jgi:hypothetical protein
MKSEDDPIGEDEWLVRRIFKDRFKTESTPIISPNAFEPRTQGRDPDHDGISLYRVACLDDPTVDVLKTIPPERHGDYAVVRIPVSLLIALGLTVKSRRVDAIRGHVVIPELNASDYKRDKSRFTSIKLQLAIEASKDENVLKRPG